MLPCLTDVFKTNLAAPQDCHQLLSSILFGAGVYSPVPYPALTLGVSGKCPLEGDEVYSLSGEYLYILLFGAEGWEVRHDHPVYSLLHSQ